MKESAPKVLIEKVEDIQSYDQIRKKLGNMLDGLKDDIRVKTAKIIVIKINLCLLKGPETGATVDPRVAEALVEWLLRETAVETLYLAEADATHLGAGMAFKALGWEETFKNVEKVEFLNLSEDQRVSSPSEYMGDLEMPEKMIQADLLVSLAKLKTHTEQKISCIMKNQFGAIPYKYKVVYHSRLAESICGAFFARPPDLCVVDGLVAMEGNGPTNGTPKRTKLLLTSNNGVSMDHFCAKLMGFSPGSVPHLRLALRRDAGAQRYFITSGSPDTRSLKFKYLPKWKELLKKSMALIQRRTINEEA